MAKYGTFKYDDGTNYDSGTGEPVFPIENLVRVPWIFRDIANDDEYEFAVNPLDANFPTPKKTVNTQYTASGFPINTEGRPQVETLSFSGTILSENHYNAMVYWLQKSTQVQIQDDLGRKFWVFLTGFSPTRRYTPDYPWRHEYSVEAVILSWD